MATVTITGATGLVARRLAQMLMEKGHQVTGLSRQAEAPVIGMQMARWDVSAQTIDAAAIEKADYIIHLAGAGVADKRWTAAYKKEIVDSRTQSCRLIAKGLQQYTHHVQAVISASGIGWYGPDTTQSRRQGFVETDAAANDFLGQTCVAWEQEADRIGETTGVRIVKIRTGLALSNAGGAFAEFKKSQRFGVTPILGSGDQVLSWIHIDDLCRLYMYAMEHVDMQGVYNAAAPAPVSNKQFMLQLSQRLRGKFYIPIHVPAFLLKMILGEMSVEVLKSTTVRIDKIKNAGFTFLYPSLDAALQELL